MPNNTDSQKFLNRERILANFDRMLAVGCKESHLQLCPVLFPIYFHLSFLFSIKLPFRQCKKFFKREHGPLYKATKFRHFGKNGCSRFKYAEIKKVFLILC